MRCSAKEASMKSGEADAPRLGEAIDAWAAAVRYEDMSLGAARDGELREAMRLSRLAAFYRLEMEEIQNANVRFDSPDSSPPKVSSFPEVGARPIVSK
jgi:hypothetical protein